VRPRRTVDPGDEVLPLRRKVIMKLTAMALAHGTLDDPDVARGTERHARELGVTVDELVRLAGREV